MEKQDTKKLLDKYIDYLYVRGLAESTITQYVIRFRIFPHDNITQDAIDEFVTQHRGSVARSFVTSYLKFRKIKDIEVPERTGRTRKRFSKRIEPDELELLRQGLYNKSNKYGLMFDVTYQGALRREETVTIRPQDFEWNIWGKDKTKPCRVHIIGKGDKERIIVVTPQIAEAVRDYISPLLKDGSILMNQPMFQCSKHNWWNIVKEVSIAVLGKRVKLHQIRHTSASDLLDSKHFDLIDLQRYLGHSNISTTQIYLHPDEEAMIKKMEGFRS